MGENAVLLCQLDNSIEETLWDIAEKLLVKGNARKPKRISIRKTANPISASIELNPDRLIA